MDRTSDTIVAPATAPGRSALGLVRLSGPRALEIGRRLVSPWPAGPRTVRRAHLRDSQGAVLDEGVVVFHAAPASFTGEDTVEFTCHGGPIIAATIVAACVASGARPAEAGEFTRRAVLNGKLDLLQAEAVGDLSDAASRSAAQVALAQLDGGLSRRISALRERIIEVEALTAYDIDFPEEDDGPVPAERILAAARDVVAQVDALIETAPVGEIVREGATVVIAGAPNVGKSSLFNALLGRRRAIVTEIPGTTRDALEAVTEADGWPMRLVDTAGLREATETVERLGIEVSREYVGRADVIIACGDSAESLRTATAAAAELSRAPVVTVRTKSDLIPAAQRARIGDAVLVSAESGDGLPALASAVANALETSHGRLLLDAPIVTRERHRFALCAARNEVQAFQAAWAGKTPAVVAAVHLREASRVLEELVGSIDVEDVLDRVFSSFCIGK